MSRAIRLSRIHAINWYGYNDSLPVEGHLLLAGVTGSGKSVLMDLIQLVLVGSDRAMFNRSATGTTSDRTLKSYCLLDTKREENGQPQYVRNSAISYVALEFTWPKDNRVETWGLRIEYRNPSENQGHVRAFYCDGALTKADFLDGERRPLETAAFKRFIEKERDGRLFETQEQYLRDMATERHLNFNRNVLSSLLPNAMSFTNLKSFDEFCRRFILPGDKLNVEDVVASYRNFQAYERDLRELREQLDRLTQISDLHRQHTEATRDRTVARWLAAALAHEHAAGLVAECKVRLTHLKAEFAKEEARIAELDRTIPDRKNEIKQAHAAIYQMPGGADYLSIKARNKILNAEIQRLKETGNSLETALRARVKNARAWLAQVQSARLPEPVETDELSLAIKQLDSCELDHSERALRAVANTVEQVKANISRAIRSTSVRLNSVREELGRLREETMMLERGIPPGPRLVLNAVNDALPRKGQEPVACQLRDLCEVTDEKWRAAVEVAFARKFAVVVPEVHYARALQVYQELKADSPTESLVNSKKALQLSKPVQPGSLAEKIHTSHPVAAAIISQFFGDLICVGKPEELTNHPQAILPDGFMSRGAFVERRRHYDGLPFVGRRGLEQQLAVKRSQVRDLEAEERRLRPLVESADQLTRNAAEYFPEHTSLIIDLTKTRDLPAREQELTSNIARLNTIDRASFEEKEQVVERLERQLDEWEKERLELVGKQKHREIAHVEQDLQDKSDKMTGAEKTFQKVKDESGDISLFVERLNTWRSEVLTEFSVLDVAARRFERLEADAREIASAAEANLHAKRRELALVYPKFAELVPESPSNEPWDKLRRQIADAGIPDYQAKSESARKQWESLFRTQVLQKLHQALNEVHRVVSLLNDYLRKQPVGDDRYEIATKPNPEFKAYRDLVGLNAVHHQDDLFFASVAGDLRIALEHFLQTLVNEPNSVEAARLLDYRHYFDYDLWVWDTRDPEAKPVSVDRQSGKFSGGENQSPYFVAIIASYLRAYQRHESRWRTPSLALVPIDEAFSKLSTERIMDCMEAIMKLDLQGVLSMSAGNIPAAFTRCDQLIIVSKHEERRGSKTHIRNVPVSIRRESPEGQEWMADHG